MDGNKKTMAVLGVLIVGMSALFVGGAFASSTGHATNSSTATQEHHSATDPAGPQHAGNQVGATGTGGAPDNTENASATSENKTGSVTDPVGSQPADHGNATAESGGDAPDPAGSQPADSGSATAETATGQ